MALKLTKTFPQGYSGEYWKLVETNVNWLERVARVTLALYVDESTRETNPLTGVMFIQSFSWTGDSYPFSDVIDVRVSAYDKIKQPILDKDGNNTNPFTDAIDA